MSVKSSSGTPKKVAASPPVDFLQSRQWQTAIKVGSVLNSNLIAPHAHWAVYFFAIGLPPLRSWGDSASLREDDSAQRDFLISLSFSIRTFAAGPDEAGF